MWMGGGLLGNSLYYQQKKFLTSIPCPGGGIGRHKGFKIPRRQLRAGSSPALGTMIHISL